MSEISLSSYTSAVFCSQQTTRLQTFKVCQTASASSTSVWETTRLITFGASTAYHWNTLIWLVDVVCFLIVILCWSLQLIAYQWCVIEEWCCEGTTVCQTGRSKRNTWRLLTHWSTLHAVGRGTSETSLHAVGRGTSETSLHTVGRGTSETSLHAVGRGTSETSSPHALCLNITEGI